MTPAAGMKIIVGEDGVLMHLIASDGGEIFFDVLELAEGFTGENRKVLLQWCRDRLKEAIAVDLPDEVRQQIEARIERIATLWG
jgi:hypothetical protein